MLLIFYAILVFCYWAFLTCYLLVNGNKISYLSSIESNAKIAEPSVVIIIPVRNEEYALKNALTSVCNLDYSSYKILVINDRSTDNTGSILTEMQLQYKNLSVTKIETLPAAWLGKNFALYTGTTFSAEEYMLFTDADVVYEKDALKKAMQFCVKNELDHLTILPGMVSASAWLNSVIMTFVIMLTAVQRPWAARIKKSTASIGVGAFNLVKRTAYVQAGTHKAIAMRPDDDLRLAALLKSSGGKTDVLYGQGEITIEWYATVKEFINGLMKNIFSGFKYNIFLAAGGVVGTLLFFVLPLPVLLIFGHTIERFLVIGVLLIQCILYKNMPGSNGKWWYGFLSIYGGLIITFVIVKATVTNLRNGGIYWRDTFYSLAELKRNK